MKPEREPAPGRCEDTSPPGRFLGLVYRRRSVRRYAPRPVEQDRIERCLEAARQAPSACNAQPWTFVVIDEPGLREHIAAAARGGAVPINAFTRQAPVLVVVVMEPGKTVSNIGAGVKDRPFRWMDVGIAAEHFCLQAAEEGLGTCMLGWFDERTVRRLLRIPDGSRPVLLLTLGYPEESGATRSRTRKALRDMSGWNAYPGALPPDRSPLRPVLGLVAWIGLTFAVAAVGGAGSARAGPFYADLLKPAWAPPAWMFGPVWTALYVMMAVAAWQVWQRRGRGARRELGLYLVQLGLNALWTWLFFAWRLGALAFFELVLLVAVVAATGRAFGRIRRSAGILLLPYLAWLVYAAALAGSLWRRNPDLL